MRTRSVLDGALASGWFGAGLPEAARTRLADLAGLTSYPVGAGGHPRRCPGRFTGVIVDGRLAIRLNVPGRDVVTILTVEPGDFIGWSAIVPPHRATSTIIALEATTVVTFEGEALASRPGCRSGSPRPSCRASSTVSRRLAATRTQMLDLFARAEHEPW